MYAEDSFFTLGMGARIALVCLTLTLSVLCLWLVWYMTEGIGRVGRVLIAVGIFYLFIWVSPQVYYMLYWAVSDGLPLQWVVQSPPNPLKLFKLLTFTDRATLTEHGQGVLGWLLIVTGLLQRRSRAD